jgi:hypothetical protein
LKKLNGARFTSPAALIVLIHPIGRGTTNALNGENFSGGGLMSMAGSINILPSNWF